MRQFQQQRRLRRASSSVAVIILLVVVLGWALYHIFGTWQKKTALTREVNRLEEQIIEIEENKKKLQEDFVRLDDPDVVEYEARKRFNIKSVGEQVLVVVDQEPASPPVKNNNNFLQRVLSWFR